MNGKQYRQKLTRMQTHLDEAQKLARELVEANDNAMFNILCEAQWNRNKVELKDRLFAVAMEKHLLEYVQGEIDKAGRRLTDITNNHNEHGI